MDLSCNDDSIPVVELSRMPQQLEVIAPEDDWTGVTSTAQRRRLQNRLNQRAYQRRKLSARPVTQEMLRQFAAEAYEAYLSNMPKLESLSILIQLNVFNALARNGAVLGISAEMLCDKGLLSPFNRRDPSFVTERCPASLHPTIVQKTVPHHPWIDLFPMPQMRDNFILACNSINEEELGIDIVSIRDSADEKPTLIVWGDSSDPQAWEASTAFMRKWGWLLRGCDEIVNATNYWRERRGEKRLVINVV